MAIETESPLFEKVERTTKEVERPDYTDAEETYLKGLRLQMENARNVRDNQRDEWDGMDYSTNYELNERAANTFIKPKKNREDTNFQSGTIRQKLFAILSSLVNLNLSGDISAFDKDGLRVQALGDAMEDVILKTNELDNDDEKKYVRQYELLKQGTVFVEEIWDERKKKSKTGAKFTGEVKGTTWNTRIKKAFSRPVRNVIPGPNVYLGDITKYDMSDQPFVFTADTMPYEEARMIFGEWERWPNVPRKLERFDPAEKINIFRLNWRLLENRDDQVEVLRYQDKWNNEFAVLLNGVLMTPVGMPLPWGYEDYNIAQQNLEPIHSKFAYGKSLVARVRNKVALLDELMRLEVLKTQQSFKIPMFNNSGRILSNRVFMPGRITHGVPPNTLTPVHDRIGEGVTSSEFAMVKELRESIDAETVSPTFSGQQAGGNPTATEIIELQRQAKMVLGLTVFAMSMLEWKLEWLRLQNILVHWFSKEDSVVDEVRGVLKEKFRNVSVERTIEGQGVGRRITIPTENIPPQEAVTKAATALSEEQKMPIELIFLKPSEIKSSKLVWQIVVRPKEKSTSEMSKLMFRAFVGDLGFMVNLGSQPKRERIEEKFASVWNEDPSKLFGEGREVEETPETTPEGTLSSRVSLPTPEKAAGREVKASLGV